MTIQSRPVTGYPAAGYPHPPPQFCNNTNGYPAAGASYPYAAPPPQAAYYYAQPYPDPCATFLRRFFGILIASFIIAATIAFIVWLIPRPRLLEFQVDSLSLSLSNFSISSSSISANWDVGFTAQNPNHKITLYYDDISTTVFYGEQPLSDTAVAPFVQRRRNETTVKATFTSSAGFVGEGIWDLGGG
ncbi:NDR1/HIN1-like protein 10 [Camellia lanceoleosa]|uniref:NDR1/HIN1-like protein 10 n=1 Tax=Camellia lanceoleosa TaxID=1840588 RepID=A0ACC0GC88_9ERIC|nr:NDR1/HIN1-like protein 10 [Camellia lanceoleosa]